MRQPGEGSQTPWGIADDAEVIAAGVVRIDTPSHGGYWVSLERLAQMPAPLRGLGSEDTGSPQWYEEDCSWAAVVVAFADLFVSSEVEAAKATLRNWFPEAWTALTGEALTSENSYVLHKREKERLKALEQEVERLRAELAARDLAERGAVIETQAEHAAWEAEPEGWVCATCGEEQEEDSSPACSSGGVWVCAACADETTRERER